MSIARWNGLLGKNFRPVLLADNRVDYCVVNELAGRRPFDSSVSFISYDVFLGPRGLRIDS